MTLTLAQELYRYGVTANAVGPAGLTRMNRVHAGRPAAIEPDDVPDDEWHPMDPSNSSPLVAWLVERRSAAPHRPGHPGHRRPHHLDARLDRAPGRQLGRQALDATELGALLNRDLFEVRHPGMRF